MKESLDFGDIGQRQKWSRQRTQLSGYRDICLRRVGLFLSTPFVYRAGNNAQVVWTLHAGCQSAPRRYGTKMAASSETLQAYRTVADLAGVAFGSRNKSLPNMPRRDRGKSVSAENDICKRGIV